MTSSKWIWVSKLLDRLHEYFPPKTFQDFSLSQDNVKYGHTHYFPLEVQGFFVHCKQNFQTQTFAKVKKSQTWNTYLKTSGIFHTPANKILSARCWPEFTSFCKGAGKWRSKANKHQVGMAKQYSFGFRINLTLNNHQYKLYVEAFPNVAQTIPTKMITSSFI